LGGGILLSVQSQAQLLIPVLSGLPEQFPEDAAEVRASIEMKEVRPQHVILEIHSNLSAPVHHALAYLIST
jgi:hypothetical protein